MNDFFQPGPPMRGWRPPAPYPEVYTPHMEPYFYNPFMPYFVAPGYLPSYTTRKDLRALSGMGSRSLVPVASSAPERGPLPRNLGRYLDRPSYPSAAEAWWDDVDTMGDDEDDDDLLGDLFGGDDFGADGDQKKRPFKAISDLFKKGTGGKTQAQQVVEAAQLLVREGHLPSQPVLIQPPKAEWSTGAKVAVGVGAGVALVGIGLLVGRALAGR